MGQKSYKYDVAFSFLSQDETLATEIYDLLQDRLKTFLYSKRQGEIAGTDGEKTFNKVFGEESRVVVVLYRPGWGETPFTRFEETAIRNRAYDHGYDFVLFIPLDEPPTTPKWLPKTRLFLGLERWGTNEAASVIEARVLEQGGEPHEETVLERAARFERESKFDKRRKEFINSGEGVRAANQEFEFLDKELQRLVTEIKNSISLEIKRDIKLAQQQIVILGFGLGLSLIWKCGHTNTLDNAELVLEVWEGHPPFSGIITIIGFENHKLKSRKFKFDLTPSETCMWHESTSNRQYDTAELASFILKQFMDEVQDRSTRI